MSNAFLRRRRPVGLYVAAIAIGLGLSVVVGLVVQTALLPDQPSDDRVPAAVPPPGTVTGLDADGRPASGRLGPLQTVQGRKLVHDVYVGYPHTPVGAVSAAVQYWSQIASTLEPARAAKIAQAIADPSWPTATRDLAKGPLRTRKSLGLSTRGRAPEGASVLLTPVAYQVRNVQADSVVVLLLAYYQVTVPGKDTENRAGVYPLEVRWAAGDWKMPYPTLSADYSTLYARPGTDEATAKGWQQLVQ